MIVRTRHLHQHKRTYRCTPLILLCLLLSLTLLSCTQEDSGKQGITLPTQNNPSKVKADVAVDIDTTSPLVTSQFSPGISHVDTSLDTQPGNNLAAINNAKALIRQAMPYEDTPIMAWGAPDPWPDPNQPEPTNWSYLDSRLQLINETGGIPVITLGEAPWWMKGELQPDGSTRVLTQNDEWADIAYNSRILDNKMGAWLHLVQRVAERYMVPPYNVRYFQVWNELKGYFNPISNHYDYTTSAGDFSGPNAQHGYTYMYNQVYDRLMLVAKSLNIPTASIKVGGPYVVMDTWSSPNQSQASTITKAYGTFDQRSLDVVLYWLQHKDGAGFIALDADNSNKDIVSRADPFTAAEKFADMTQWLRSLNPATYPGATTLPVWLAEWYATSYDYTPNDAYNTAIKAYALMKFLEAGGAVALSWGSKGSTPADVSIWTPTNQANGGRASSFYYILKELKDNFGPGVRIYQTTITSPESVEALASSNRVMLVNKTANTLTVSLNYKKVVMLQPYQVEILPLPAL
jgi:hypothetical protein